MLTYNIPESLNTPLYLYIYECIKNDIRKGNIKANEKLPSKRNLAKQLEVSLITIENAYSQLLIEGYITSIEKKGYFVNEVEIIHHDKKKRKVKESTHRDEDNYLIDFTGSFTSTDSFPFSIWSRLSRKVLSEDKDKILKTPGYKGSMELRKAICRHLKDFFTMDVSYEQIIIGSGSEYLYSQLVQLFDDKTVYALEDPGHKSIAKVYNANNCLFHYIKMDDEGIVIDELKKSKANVVHVSSSHQYPTGISMPVKRRYELIRWAKENNGIIIEDDYDSEFRLKGKPISPIYDLDKEHTIYMNTFSITLSPSFRIAYMVLPESLLEDYERKLGFYRCTVPVFDQLVLSRFIDEHYFERHISRMRKKYKESRDYFIKELKNTNYKIRIKEADSGLHFLIEHGYKINDEKLKQITDELKIKIHPLSYFMHDNKDTKTLILRYMAIEDKKMAVDKLKELFERLSKEDE